MPDNTLNHIAIIMDGNGRWAVKNNLPKIIGHKKGKKTLQEIIQYCSEIKLNTLTVFAFSNENNNRSKTEVQDLFKLFLLSLKTETKTLNKNNIKLDIIGDLSIFNKETQLEAKKSQQKLKNNNGLNFIIALNYSGQWDIINACKKTTKQVLNNSINIGNINANTFKNNLSLAGKPEVDILIRTSGEMRISNFLLWDIAYSELFFTDTLWPDFNKNELQKIIAKYQDRDRRFGS